MRIALALLLVALPAIVSAQTPLPADVNPVTLSRMPPINRAELDAEGQKALDARTTPPAPAPGPGSVTDRGYSTRLVREESLTCDFSTMQPLSTS